MTVTIPNTSGDIQITELTSPEGNGVFDKMLEGAIKAIRTEYDLGKIRSTDFVNALVALIPQVLDQANKYSLAKAKLPLELQALEADIAKTATDTVVATKQGALIDAQASREMSEINKLNAETALELPAQLDKIKAETQQILDATDMSDEEFELKKQSTLADIDLKENQLALGQQEIELKKLQIPLTQRELDLKQAQVDASLQDIAVKKLQVEEEQYKLANTLPNENALSKSQVDLYNQKVITEKAQTQDIADPNSAIGRNNEVLKQQALGFLRRDKQTTANILVDAWKVRNNADPDGNGANDYNKLNDERVGKFISMLGTDYGLTL